MIDTLRSRTAHVSRHRLFGETGKARNADYP